jgi:hypothetical protein
VLASHVSEQTNASMPCVCCFGPLRERPGLGDQVPACRRCGDSADASPAAITETGRCPVHGAPLLSRWHGISDPLPSFEPVFTTPTVNDPVTIATGGAELHQSMANAAPVLSGKGSLELEWLPFPRTLARFAFSGVGSPGVGVGPSRLQIVGTDFTVDLHQDPPWTRWNDEGFIAEVTGHVLTGFLCSGRPLVEVTAHLVNFPVFLWRDLPDRSWHGGLRLRAEGWEVLLREVAGRSSERDASRIRGFVISHGLRLTRPDGSTFSEDEAELLLQGLLYFFSFGRASWSTPILAVGRGETGVVGFRQLTVWNASPARWVPTWLDDQHPQALMELFPEFWHLWHRPTSRETLQRTIHWYVVANESSSAETGLVLAQLALDRLAWEIVFGGSTAQMTPNQRRYTSARITALINRFAIPSAIPARSGKLLELAFRDHPQDPQLRTGPVALSSARNAIVHPDWNADPQTAEAAVLEARNLALWYLELSLLAWMKYTGDHQWRLREAQVTGEVEPVPWARPERWAFV